MSKINWLYKRRFYELSTYCRRFWSIVSSFRTKQLSNYPKMTFRLMYVLPSPVSLVPLFCAAVNVGQIKLTLPRSPPQWQNVCCVVDVCLHCVVASAADVASMASSAAIESCLRCLWKPLNYLCASPALESIQWKACKCLFRAIFFRFLIDCDYLCSDIYKTYRLHLINLICEAVCSLSMG